MATDDKYADALPPRYRIREYNILRVLGAGGFGITYLAHDTSLVRDVAIKEYLPRDYAVRTEDHSVRPRSSETSEDYAWGLQRFLDEARTLARLDHSSIVRVHTYFEAHGTGYIVMEHIAGETLHNQLKRRGKLDEVELTAILNSLIDGLEQVHGAGFLHRDITPKNILLNVNGAPVLIDFGSARQMAGARTRGVTALVTPGYAPLEQYSIRGRQGPWTDVYGLSAVAYQCITGTVPLDATERVQGDELVPASKAGRGRFSAGLLAAVDQGLSLKAVERPPDPKAWRRVRIEASADAAKRCRVAAEKGDTRAQFFFGTMHYQGRDVSENRPEAMKWYRLAAEQGDSHAQAMVGFMYQNGRGVTQDDAKAGKWYRLAAEQGNGYAQYVAGLGQFHHLIASADTAKCTAAATTDLVETYLTDLSAGLTSVELRLLTTAFAAQNFLGTDDQSMELPSELDKDSPKQVAVALTALKRRIAADPALTNRWHLHYRTLERMRDEIIAHGVLPDERVKLIRMNKYYVMSEFAYWYRLVARRGVGPAQDDLRFVRLRLSAELGNASAQYDLGFMYLEGREVTQDDVQAVKWFRLSAEQGNASAQYAVGFMRYEGRGIRQDNDLAVSWCRLAAEQGHAEAQYNLGSMYDSPLLDDAAKAFEWYRRAAEHGNAIAQYALGLQYERGHGVARNNAKAMTWFRMAADMGNAVAQYHVAVSYAEGRVIRRNDDLAVKWCRLAAEHGNAYARCNLGLMYAKGLRVAQDDAEAVDWYRQAAEQGHVQAQCNLGFMYTTGRGVPADEAEAMRWYRLAAEEGGGFERNHFGTMYERESLPGSYLVRSYGTTREQGDPDAQYDLGTRYEEGRGVSRNVTIAADWYWEAAEQGHVHAQLRLGFLYTMKDDTLALKWFRLAAEQGDAIAQYNLGVIYAEGQGVPQDDAEAARWFKLSATQGDVDAQRTLGNMHEWGNGVGQDDAKALRWYWLAAKQGDAFAQYRLGEMYEVGKGMVQDQTEAAKWYRLAAEQGDQDAQVALGAMYEEGRGVPQDDAEAARWYRAASAEQGDTEDDTW